MFVGQMNAMFFVFHPRILDTIDDDRGICDAYSDAKFPISCFVQVYIENQSLYLIKSLSSHVALIQLIKIL